MWYSAGVLFVCLALHEQLTWAKLTELKTGVSEVLSLEGSGEEGRIEDKPADEEEINGGLPDDFIHEMGFFEADMLLTSRQKLILDKYREEIAKKEPLIHKRAVIANLALKWKDGIVPYVISSRLNAHLNVISQSMSAIESQTCIKFVQRTRQRDYIRLIRGDGCYSYVGRIDGRQSVSIGDSCEYQGIIIHELLHALGRWHEHNRPDRDQYIEIHPENIRNGLQDQFERIPSDEASTNGLTYDFTSIMHYSAYAFSRNRRPTITPRDRQISLRSLGQRDDLSPLDAQHINRLYCNQPSPTWSQWSSWGPCSVSCGNGQQTRTRTCSNGNCQGSSSDSRQCQRPQCPGVWNAWSSWSACSVTCGNGQQTRRRSCQTTNCQGSSTDTRQCQLVQCPGLWGAWSQWSACSATCGEGRQMRSRSCMLGSCLGTSTEARRCQQPQCVSSWNSWGQWSACSAQCGNTGRRWRTRTCSSRAQTCVGQFIQYESCTSQQCQGNGMSAWSSWYGTCRSWNCESGYRLRYRTCVNPSLGCASRFQYETRRCSCSQQPSFQEERKEVSVQQELDETVSYGDEKGRNQTSDPDLANTEVTSGDVSLKLSWVTTVVMVVGCVLAGYYSNYNFV